MNSLKINYKNSFVGNMINERNEFDTKIGEDGLMPYELAMSGIVSCFYSTFIDIALKKRLEWESVLVDIFWEKSNEEVAFLKEAKIKLQVKTIKGSDTNFDKSFELAAKYCSLYQTFSRVAALSWEATYE